MVCKSLVERVLTFNITVWYSNLSVANRNKLTRVVNMAGKIIGKKQNQLCDLYNIATRRKAKAIVSDTSHPLHLHFEKMPSGRRYRVPVIRNNLFKKSFVPSAITILNTDLCP